MDGYTLWTKILHSECISTAINDTNFLVRSSICTAYSHISPETFEKLKVGNVLLLVQTKKSQKSFSTYAI